MLVYQRVFLTKAHQRPMKNTNKLENLPIIYMILPFCLAHSADFALKICAMTKSNGIIP
jgi:hypothetical protein